MKTVPFTHELFSDIVGDSDEYYQLGETVCGAEDPAVVTLSQRFRDDHPEYRDYTTVRIVDQYVGPNRSETLMEFSNTPITAKEYQYYEAIADEYED